MEEDGGFNNVGWVAGGIDGDHCGYGQEMKGKWSERYKRKLSLLLSSCNDEWHGLSLDLDNEKNQH